MAGFHLIPAIQICITWSVFTNDFAQKLIIGLQCALFSATALLGGLHVM